MASRLSLMASNKGVWPSYANRAFANVKMALLCDLEWDNEQQNQLMQTLDARHQILGWKTLQIKGNPTGFLRATWNVSTISTTL